MTYGSLMWVRRTHGWGSAHGASRPTRPASRQPSLHTGRADHAAWCSPSPTRTPNPHQASWPRLAAIDLDGTLLRTDGTVSTRSRAALEAAQAAGIDIVLVTARSPRSVRVIASDLGLGGVALCANGATVYDLDADVILHHRPLQVDVAHRVVGGLRERVPGIAFAWELELRFGSEPEYETRRDTARWPRPGDAYPPCDALEWREPMTKLLARVPEAPTSSRCSRQPARSAARTPR